MSWPQTSSLPPGELLQGISEANWEPRSHKGISLCSPSRASSLSPANQTGINPLIDGIPLKGLTDTEQIKAILFPARPRGGGRGGTFSQLVPSWRSECTEGVKSWIYTCVWPTSASWIFFLRVIFSPGSRPGGFQELWKAPFQGMRTARLCQPCSLIGSVWRGNYYFWLGNCSQSLCLSQSHPQRQGMTQGWAQSSRGCYRHPGTSRDEERGLGQGWE